MIHRLIALNKTKMNQLTPFLSLMLMTKSKPNFYSLSLLLFFNFCCINNVISQQSCANVDVTTLAGSAPNRGYVDGIGAIARFNNPTGVAVDMADNIYVTDFSNRCIRKITSTGTVTSFTGQPTLAYADGVLNTAGFRGPTDIAIDALGNIYITDYYGIRKITPSGNVSTFAGDVNNSGSTDGIGTNARFGFLQGITVGPLGNVYVCDAENNTIRKVSPAGVVSTIAGVSGSVGSTDGAGNIAKFNIPKGIAIDDSGNIFVTDQDNNTIRKISTSGLVSTFAGLAGSFGHADGVGNAARFRLPNGLTIDGSNNLYLIDKTNQIIRKITPSGIVSTIAGTLLSSGSNDGIGTDARFNHPNQLTFDNAGNLIIADNLNHTIRKIGNCTTSCSAQFTPYRDDFSCLGYTFSNESTGDNLTYFWNFGDGQLDTTTQSTLLFHYYPDFGDYTVTLIVEGTDGCRDTLSQNIQLVNQLDPFIHGISALDSCCAAFGMTTTRDVSDIEIEILTPGVTFANTTLFPGFKLASHSNATKAVVQSSFFPHPISGGTYHSVIDFCFDAGIQEVDYAIHWYFRPAEAPFLICSDTLSYRCETDKCQPNLAATTFSTAVETPELGGIKSDESFYSGIVDCNGDYVALGTLERKGPHTKNFPLHLAKFDQDGHLISSTKQVESPINTAVFDVEHMDLIQVDSCNGYLAVAAYTEDQMTWKTMLIRFDNNCNLLYTKKVDLSLNTFAEGSSNVQPNQLIQDSNGDFLIIGTMDNGVNSNILLFRWNENAPGTTCDTRSYFLSGITNDKGIAITEVSNLGTTKYLITGQRDGQLLLLSVDNNLSPLQTKIYQITPSSNEDIGRSIKQFYTSPDIYISGETSNGIASNWLLMKVSGASATFGNVDWVKKGTSGIPGQREVGMDVEIAGFGDIFMGGYTYRNGDPTYNPDSEGLLIKFTPQGFPIWTRTYTPNSNFAKIYDIAFTPDKGMALFGNQWTFDLPNTTAHYNFWVAKTDEKGLLTEESCYNCPDIEQEMVTPIMTTLSLFNFNYSCSINDCPMSLVDEPMNLQTFCGEAITTKCDSIEISYTGAGEHPRDSCCFMLNITNSVEDCFTAVQLHGMDDLNIWAYSSNNDWFLQNTSNTSPLIYAPNFNIPVTDSTDFLKICLTNFNGTTQRVAVDIFGGAPDFQVECTDTLIFNCLPPAPLPKCVKIINDTVTCSENESYNFSFDVMADSLAPFSIQSIRLNAPNGITLSEEDFILSPPIAPNNMQGSFTTAISGGTPGDTLCFFLTAHDIDINSSDTLNAHSCCTDTIRQICIVLPECPVPCPEEGIVKLIGDSLDNHFNEVKYFNNAFYAVGNTGSSPYITGTFSKISRYGQLEWSIKLDTFSNLFDFEQISVDEFLLVGRNEPVQLSGAWQDTKSIISKVKEISNQGNLLWTKTYQMDNDGREAFFRIIKSKVVDNYPYFIAGVIDNSTKSSRDLVNVLKVDENGNSSCSNYYTTGNGIDHEVIRNIIALDNGGIALVGNYDGRNAAALFINTSCGIDKSYQFNSNTVIDRIHPIRNSTDYILTGFTGSPDQGFICRVNNQMQPIGTGMKTATQNRFFEIEEDMNGHFYVLGDATSNTGKIIINKFNISNTGVITSLWSKYIDDGTVRYVSGNLIANGNQISYSDSRTGNSGAFGNHDILIANLDTAFNSCNTQSLSPSFSSFSLSTTEISNFVAHALPLAIPTLSEISEIVNYSCSELCCDTLPDLSKCDSIHIAYNTIPESPKDSCCFMLNITNQVDSCLTAIQLHGMDDLKIWSYSSNNDWYLQNTSNASPLIYAPNLEIPVGGPTDFLKICLTNFDHTTQRVAVDIFGNAPDYAVVCTDTLIFNCPIPSPDPKCIKIINDTIACSDNEQYNLTFDVMADSLAQFDVKSIRLNAPPGITLSKEEFLLMPPIMPNNMQGSFTTSITGANSGDTLCFSLTAHDIDINSSDTLNEHSCCTDTIQLFCVVIPECDPCFDVMASYTMIDESTTDTCCFSIDLTNNHDANYFTNIETEILTPNVTFGIIDNFLGSGWGIISNSNNRNIRWRTFPPNGNYVPINSSLPKMCLRNIVNPTQVPQHIEIRWMVNDSIACRDTLEINCDFVPVSDGCADIPHSSLVCNNNGTYQYTFDVQNNTTTQMESFALVSVNPAGSISPTSFSIPIAPNSTSSTQTVTITGTPGTDVCFKVNLHDINNGNHFNCCFNDSLICVTLPLCDTTTTDDCCLALSNPTSNPFNLSGGNSWQGIDFLKDGGLHHYIFGSSNTIKVAPNIGLANAPNYDLSSVNTISGSHSVKKPYNYDYNKDGNDDYFAKDELTNEIIYFENNGNLNFTAYPTGVIIQSPIAHGLNFIAIGDLSNDGLPDLVVTNRGAYNNGTGILVHYYEHLSGANCNNNGVPCFSLTVSNPLIDDNFLTPNGGTPIPEIFDGDCDGDEDLYIGVVGNIWEFKNNGGVAAAGTLPDLERVNYNSNPYGISGVANSNTEFVAPRFVDVDNDGKSELFIDDYTQILFYENCENDTIPNNCIGGIELITNGEFTDGNTAFTSEYTYTTDCPDRDYPIGPYQCTLINDYDDVCTFSIDPPAIQDYTTGAGLFLLFSDGYFPSSKPELIVWKQENIAVTPNTNYKLSAWVDFVDVQNENAELTFLINGQNIISSKGTFLVHEGWKYLEASWSSGTTTSIDIEIITNNNLRPNTIALDNISLKECGKVDPCPIIRTEEGNVVGNHSLFAQTEIRSSVNILPNAILRYQSGNIIHLRPGFHAQAGSQFTATLASSFNCGPLLNVNVDSTRISLENKLQTSEKIVNDDLHLKVAPNPFNQQTIIDFFLPNDGYLNLSIRDINGRNLSSIFKGNQQKGKHQIQFNNTNLLPGIYYIILHTEKEIISKKVIILNN